MNTNQNIQTHMLWLWVILVGKSHTHRKILCCFFFHSVSLAIPTTLPPIRFNVFCFLASASNIALALLSFVCISCIVLCCIGFMVVAGWKFGLMEAICGNYSLEPLYRCSVFDCSDPMNLSLFLRGVVVLWCCGVVVLCHSVSGFIFVPPDHSHHLCGVFH